MINHDYIVFPDPKKASKDGLVAMGGDLSPDMLISAYMQGIFPWFNENDPILWWSPDPRMILIPKEMKVSKTLNQTIRNKNFSVQFDNNFENVIKNCAKTKRKGQKGTWITKEMEQAYCKLHEMGIAHSVEVYNNAELVGGLYGVSLGKIFFGESMFYIESNASKIALFHLCQFLQSKQFLLIDVQQSTKHLQSLGAKEIARNEFLEIITPAVQMPIIFGKWIFEG